MIPLGTPLIFFAASRTTAVDRIFVPSVLVIVLPRRPYLLRLVVTLPCSSSITDNSVLEHE